MCITNKLKKICVHVLKHVWLIKWKWVSFSDNANFCVFVKMRITVLKNEFIKTRCFILFCVSFNLIIFKLFWMFETVGWAITIEALFLTLSKLPSFYRPGTFIELIKTDLDIGRCIYTNLALCPLWRTYR